MNNTCSKRFTHYYTSRPVSFYIYTLTPLWSIQSQIAADNTRSGYYHPQYKLTNCQVPNLSHGWGEMRG